MASKDRTAEFMATINSKLGKPQFIQQRNALAAAENMSTKDHKLANDESYRNFMKLSKECAYSLKESYEKLERLTILAKRRTVFDDGELNRLVAEIRTDIGELKRRVDDLTSRQHPKQKHSKNIVTSLQQRLADMSSSFKSTLELRSKSVQQQTARHELYAGSSTKHPLNQTQTGYSDRQNQLSIQSNGPMVIDMNGLDGYDNETNQTNQMQAMMLQEKAIHILPNDDTYMSERVNTMQTIESTIVELGSIFNQLATMVQAQDETIMRIDSNVVETAGNVEAAHEALLRYFSSINNNRWLILKTFGLLFIFFVIFVVFGT